MAFLHLLAELRTPALNSLMSAVSFLGTPHFAIGIIAFFYLCISKKFSYGLIFSYCFSGIISQGLKLFFRVPRPWNLDTTFQPVGSAVSTAGGYSFPSVHSQSAASVYSALFIYYRKKPLRFVFILLAVLILFSRMYLGCHTPLDVGVGGLIGLSACLLFLPYWKNMDSSDRNDGILIFFLAAFSMILLFLAVSFFGNGTVDYDNVKDSLSTSGLSIGFTLALIWERRSLKFSVRGTLLQKTLRFLIAFAGALVILYAVKRIGGTSVPVTIIRYAFTGFWMLGITPAIALKTGLCFRETEA